MTEQPKVPTLTSANAAAPVAEQHPTIHDEDIVAKPLGDPDFTNLQPVNPAISFRWVNRVAGNDGKGGRYAEMTTRGFAVAKVTDVKGGVPPHLQKDGVIIYGDLILMKMPRVDYVGALKHNEQQAIGRIKSTVMGTGKSELNKALGEVPGSAENKGKIKLFEPQI